MMRNVFYIVIIICLISCESNNQLKSYYRATKNDTIALLSLTINETSFFGQYEIQYSSSIKDSGEVRGEKIGDTLKGRFKYISYGGNLKIVPFVVLKRGQVYIEGKGSIWTLFNIPYYNQESLEFDNSNFKFLPIGNEFEKKVR